MSEAEKKEESGASVNENLLSPSAATGDNTENNSVTFQIQRISSLNVYGSVYGNVYVGDTFKKTIPGVKNNNVSNANKRNGANIDIKIDLDHIDKVNEVSEIKGDLHMSVCNNTCVSFKRKSPIENLGSQSKQRKY
uniref:Uncharacterized protein n=1 Tax=Panagrolaimus sp. ES5 TaxID=591445 RepID=A0AC34FF31_9BILA